MPVVVHDNLAAWVHGTSPNEVACVRKHDGHGRRGGERRDVLTESHRQQGTWER
jgi:hypothetical protein